MKIKALLVVLCFGFLISRYAAAQTSGSFVYDGINRSYTLFVPPGWTPEKHYPLLLALHGLTQTGNEMMAFTGFNSYASEYGFVVAYPNGVSNSWNVGFIAGSTADDVGFLSALIDTLHEQYSIDLSRVYTTGFSNGGFMCYRLACELGDRIAAIASVSGTMTTGSLSGCQPQRTMPVMHIHGTSDMVVFYNGGLGNVSVNQVLTYWTGFNTCPAVASVVNLPDLVQEGSTVQRISWMPCQDSTEVVHLKVVGGGHTWPGSIGTTGTGNTNRDIIASDEIWKFVSRFSIRPTTTGFAEQLNSGILVFPNPASGNDVSVRIRPSNSISVIEIVTPEGIRVGESQIPAGEAVADLNISHLKKGMYILRLKNESVYSSSKLLIR